MMTDITTSRDAACYRADVRRNADGINGCIVLTNGEQVERTDIGSASYPVPVEQAIQAARRHPASFLADTHRRTALVAAITT